VGRGAKEEVSIKSAISAGLEEYKRSEKQRKVNIDFSFYDEPNDDGCSFSNGNWCVKRNEKFHRKLVEKLIESIKKHESYIYKDYQKPGRKINYESIKGYSFIGRWLDDCNSSLYTWWSIQANFCLVCFREYGQQYYANHCQHDDSIPPKEVWEEERRKK